VRVQRHAPAAFYLQEKTLCPLYRKLCGSQGRFGHERKISPLLNFDPRTVQFVASRYTDNATRTIIFRIAYEKEVARNLQTDGHPARDQNLSLILQW
jgi:hypothetical protein